MRVTRADEAEEERSHAAGPVPGEAEQRRAERADRQGAARRGGGGEGRGDQRHPQGQLRQVTVSGAGERRAEAGLSGGAGPFYSRIVESPEHTHHRTKRRGDVQGELST